MLPGPRKSKVESRKAQDAQILQRLARRLGLPVDSLFSGAPSSAARAHTPAVADRGDACASLPTDTTGRGLAPERAGASERRPR